MDRRAEAGTIFATLPGCWQGLKVAQGFPALVEGPRHDGGGKLGRSSIWDMLRSKLGQKKKKKREIYFSLFPCPEIVPQTPGFYPEVTKAASSIRTLDRPVCS